MSTKLRMPVSENVAVRRWGISFIVERETTQNVLDIIGIIDPSPAVDTVNAVISLVRAGKSSNPAEKKRHMTNAGISAIAGWIP